MEERAKIVFKDFLSEFLISYSKDSRIGIGFLTQMYVRCFLSMSAEDRDSIRTEIFFLMKLAAHNKFEDIEDFYNLVDERIAQIEKTMDEENGVSEL